MDRKVVIEDREPFRIEVECWDDTDFDFSHYGRFCELEGNRYGGPSRPRNWPDGGDFYIRNTNAWAMRDEGNGTDSWVRTDRRSYGWFKLAEHPRHAVEHMMKEEGLDERSAWRKELDRLSDLVDNIARGNIWAVGISVTVYWNDEIVGDTVLGGIEVDSYVDGDDVVRLANEHDLIDEALGYARKHIEEHCKKAMLAYRPDGATNAA